METRPSQRQPSRDNPRTITLFLCGDVMTGRGVDQICRGRIKLSPQKSNLPGPKQIFRTERGGRATGDVLGVRGEAVPGRPLLVPVMRGGRRTEAGAETLAGARQRARDEQRRLPDACLRLEAMETPSLYTVSPALASETARLRAALARP